MLFQGQKKFTETRICCKIFLAESFDVKYLVRFPGWENERLIQWKGYYHTCLSQQVLSNETMAKDEKLFNTVCQSFSLILGGVKQKLGKKLFISQVNNFPSRTTHSKLETPTPKNQQNLNIEKRRNSIWYSYSPLRKYSTHHQVQFLLFHISILILEKWKKKINKQIKASLSTNHWIHL